MNCADYEHLIRHTQQQFPSEQIEVTYPEEEVIHIKVGDRLFVFEIGSDDDEYVFIDGCDAFTIQLMDGDFWDFS